MKTIGYLIWALGFVFLIVETHYFGSNFWPSSSEEIIADGIGVLICTIGIAVVSLDKHNKEKP